MDNKKLQQWKAEARYLYEWAKAVDEWEQQIKWLQSLERFKAKAKSVRQQRFAKKQKIARRRQRLILEQLRREHDARILNRRRRQAAIQTRQSRQQRLVQQYEKLVRQQDQLRIQQETIKQRIQWWSGFVVRIKDFTPLTN